jgi:glutathione S-transferase
MRARLAIAYTKTAVQLREVVLKNKPQALIDISAKATVPVLQIHCSTQGDLVIDESLDIMLWALTLHDDANWLAEKATQLALIKVCDDSFKAWLDKYKYADRHLEHPVAYYRAQCEIFIEQLDKQLAQQKYLFATEIKFADAAIFPFIRQFAHVDKAWFLESGYTHVINWYSNIAESTLFQSIMTKYPAWHEGQEPVWFADN